MPILNRIQRRSLSGRILMACFYTLLVAGAVWMVYPFLLMVGGSVKSEVDARQLGLIPAFLLDETMLFRKFSEQRYGRIDLATAATRCRDARGNRLYSFESLELPREMAGPVRADWDRFLAIGKQQWPDYYWMLGHAYGTRTMPEVAFQYLKEVRNAFPSQASAQAQWALPPEEWYSRSYQGAQGPYAKIYHNVRSSLDQRYFYPVPIEGIYILHVVSRHYSSLSGGIQVLNEDWGTRLPSIWDVVLPARVPANPREQAMWSEFVKDHLSPRFIALDDDQLPHYQAFLRGRYKDLEVLNWAYNTRHVEWPSVRFPGEDCSASAFHDAALYLKTLDDLSGVSIRSPGIEWRKYLRGEYGNDIRLLNEAWQSAYQTFGDVPMPMAAHDRRVLEEHKGAIIWDLLTRNYRFAWDQMASNGNGLRNTIIFCLLSVLAALIVNPLAAYALSRFQPRWGRMALFAVMATTAFPAEVTQIPSFLLLRDLGWLNTFAALVIPAAANGYSIFLLKGFFDGLPKDFYEAASLDGCGELRMFFLITVPLSLPILAVIALGAFAAAYGAFMFALLVCQKESMWTLMVYIYQMQQFYEPPIIFAALIIASIPTLVVFTLCQNVIMRGIVVPVEK